MHAVLGASSEKRDARPLRRSFMRGWVAPQRWVASFGVQRRSLTMAVI